MKLKRCNLHYEKIGSEVKCIEAEIPFEIPDSWCWCRFESIIELTNGISKRRGTGGIDTIVLRLADLVEDTISFTQTRRINLIKKEIDQYSLQKNDLLFIRVNGSRLNVGKVFIFDSDSCVAYCDHLMRGKNRASDVSSTYIKHLFGATDIRKIVEDRIVSAAGQNTVSQTSLTNILIPMAPANEQNKIVNAITLAFEQVSVIESEESDLQTIIAQAKSKILDLAIRGKLVLQDPADEPASVLLERIRAEKEQLIKVGKIKREKNESYIFRGDDKSYYQDKGGKRLCVEEMIPFDLPQQWLWCQLGEICDYGNCNNTDTATLPDDAWILDLEDIEKDTGKVLQRITVAERKSNSTKHAFHNGQLLYSKLRPYLNKVLVADDDGYCTSEILPLEFANIVFPPYARHVLMSAYFLGYANQCSYGVKMPRLGTNDGKRAWIPLPPLSEQHRITAAVDAAFAELDTIADALA